MSILSEFEFSAAVTTSDPVPDRFRVFIDASGEIEFSR